MLHKKTEKAEPKNEKSESKSAKDAKQARRVDPISGLIDVTDKGVEGFHPAQDARAEKDTLKSEAHEADRLTAFKASEKRRLTKTASAGNIVMYTEQASEVGAEQKPFPGIVTSVTPEGLVNLTIFRDHDLPATRTLVADKDNAAAGSAFWGFPETY